MHDSAVGTLYEDDYHVSSNVLWLTESTSKQYKAFICFYAGKTESATPDTYGPTKPNSFSAIIDLFMGSYAWYYHADGRTYYWTESYNMSATQFAREVSRMTGKSLTASDISAASRQADVDRLKNIASPLIYVP